MSRVVFAGTPEFASVSLDAMVQSGIRPVAVLTQPDRPAGRGKKLRESAVKKYALEHDLQLMQPASLKDADIVGQLESLNADLFVVAAYGLLLPQSVLDIPKRACVNVHASLLPLLPMKGKRVARAPVTSKEAIVSGQFIPIVSISVFLSIASI